MINKEREIEKENYQWRKYIIKRKFYQRRVEFIKLYIFKARSRILSQTRQIIQNSS